MGIYDRDYYRDDDGGWWASMAGKQATVGLVMATGVVGLLQLFSMPLGGGPIPGADPITKWADFSQSAVTNGQVWRFLTPVFLTDLNTAYPLWRVALTMLVLYYVGLAAETTYGTREFLAFYLTAGFVVYFGRFVAGVFENDLDPHAVGAGGAVTAALTLYACHHPYEKWWFFYVVPVPVWALAVAAVVLDLLAQLRVGAGYPSYLVGALFALAYFRQQVRLTDVWDRVTGPLFSGRGRRASPRLSVYSGPDESDEVPVPAGASRPARANASGHEGRSVDEQLEAKLDQVLEKVSRFGRDSLTPEETQILLRASEIYKRRRGS